MPNHNDIFKQAILDFPRQFEYEPEVINAEKLGNFKRAIVIGMGGSHLAADILQNATLPLRLSIHSGYGLPSHIPEEELRESLIIASSYSGNTEEVLDAFETAHARGLSLAAIASGGVLLDGAREHGIPHIMLSHNGIQPRSAMGIQFCALAKLLGLSGILEEARALANSLHPEELELRAKDLANRLHGKMPIVYAGAGNYGLAYYWKIIMNETAKIPAFWSLLPEANHNEMTGFDGSEECRELARDFTPIFLADEGDHERVKKRMILLEKMYNELGLQVETVEMTGENMWHKTFSSITLANWTAYHLAELSGAEANDVRMVEEFKRALKEI